MTTTNMLKKVLLVVATDLVFLSGVMGQSERVMGAVEREVSDPQVGIEAPNSVPRVIRGTDRVVGSPRPGPSFQGGAISFKFEDAPLLDVVNLVLGEIMKVDYILHQPISGSVTMAARDSVSPDQAVLLLEGALQAHGILMVRDSRGTYHVGRAEALKGIVATTRQASKDPLPPGYGAIVVPLQFIGAGEMATILRSMVPAEALVRVDNVRNLLVLVGTRTQAEGWLDIVNTFDVDLLKGMSVGVFPLKHATVKEVESALRMMTSGGSAQGSTPSGGRPPSAGSSQGAGTGPATLPETFPLFGALRVMPIERINSILVVTPRAAYLDEVRVWIERLDKPGTDTAASQIYVYSVQNGSAKHLASVLNSIFGSPQATSQGSTGTGVSPRFSPATAVSNPPNSTTGGGGLTGGLSTLQGQAGQVGQSSIVGSGVTSINLNQGARVAADELNNAIIIYGTRAEYNLIEASLKRLDLPATQVLIEASIVEVTLDDSLSYGVQWLFTDQGRDGLYGTGSLGSAANGAFGPTAAGAFSYTLRNSLGNVRAVLQALAGKSSLKVISSPSLMVLDNHTAAISVGTQQPIRTGETISVGGNISTSIQYKDTGVSLAVTPSVNAGNMVTMHINQTITDVGPTDTEATGQRTFLQRQISSKVAVRSGETLVLGGLIRDNTTVENKGVPGLQDIPFFGTLFGTKAKKLARTELLVIITPRVVKSDQDVREVSQEIRERMKVFGAP
jgi:general secretion pathway protein D